MVIEEKVQALLEAAVVVPVERIKPSGDWQSLARPYVVHFPIAADTRYHHGGRATLTAWGYQVSCFADSYSEARTIAQAVVSALTGNHGEATFFWSGQGAAQFESDTRVHHIALRFEVFEAL